MAKTIAVSVSTIRGNEERVREFFTRNAQALERFDQVILLMQGCSETGQPAPPPNNFRNFVFDSTAERGLSRSRNRALELCSCDYLWILDDDVLIEQSAFAKIQKAIEDLPSAKVLTFEFVDIDDLKTLAKKYPPKRRLRGVELLRVSSIEIIVSVDFVKKSKIRFNINYGLGGEVFPSGEETVFLLDLKDAGAEIFHIDQTIVFHPLAGRSISKFWRMPRRLYGMGTIARRFGVGGFALVIRWALRGVRNGLPADLVFDLFRGYFLKKVPEQ
jgi:hypothetical protein